MDQLQNDLSSAGTDCQPPAYHKVQEIACALRRLLLHSTSY